ncbi:MAG: hypothetical protein ACD_20C00173G0004 [uncultured bacterium]|nr:MAG: hypothetical protein ACD_20C00173G0004 [uncultured bacterium]
MVKKNILIVEDEEDILELIKYNLYKEGYDVNGVTSGEDALKVIKSKEVSPDLVILDLMLPDLDGFEVCKFLKNNLLTQHISIIMLTAKGAESDIIAGLDIGADDYITKPFSPKVLIARIKTVFRRETKKTLDDSSIVKIDNLTINSSKYEVLIQDKPIKLTNNEFKALFLLASQRGWVFTRNQIINAINGNEYDVTDRSIDVLIVGLRKKLGNYSEYIETVHGVGYRFKG